LLSEGSLSARRSQPTATPNGFAKHSLIPEPPVSAPDDDILIRDARPDDVALIAKMVMELAIYEQAPEQCHATPEKLHAQLFGPNPPARAMIAEINGVVAGYSIYFFNFSTWEAAPGLYLEDVYVRPAWRRRGVASLFLRRLAQIAVERGCKRLEWMCLDWNKPARDFYEGLGAQAKTDWVLYRTEGDALARLAHTQPPAPAPHVEARSVPEPYSNQETDIGTLRQPLDALKTVTIHTDGGAEPNPGIGGWAAILRFGDKVREISGSEPESTNNRMELMAAIKALETLREPCVVHIHTDSAYVKNGITKWIHAWKKAGWKRGKGKDASEVKNIDLWQRLDAAAARHEMHWRWVKGHAGNADNERADELCAEAIAKLRRGA